MVKCCSVITHWKQVSTLHSQLLILSYWTQYLQAQSPREDLTEHIKVLSWSTVRIYNIGCTETKINITEHTCERQKRLPIQDKPSKKVLIYLFVNLCRSWIVQNNSSIVHTSGIRLLDSAKLLIKLGQFISHFFKEIRWKVIWPSNFVRLKVEQ